MYCKNVDSIQLNYTVISGGNHTINVYFMTDKNYSKFFQNKYYRKNVSYEYIKYFHQFTSFSSNISIPYDSRYTLVSDNFFSDSWKYVKFSIELYGQVKKSRNYNTIPEFILIFFMSLAFIGTICTAIVLKSVERTPFKNKQQTNSNKLRRWGEVIQHVNKPEDPIFPISNTQSKSMTSSPTEKSSPKSPVILEEPVKKSNNIASKEVPQFYKEKLNKIHKLLEEHEIKLNKICILLENSHKEVIQKDFFNRRCKHCGKEFLFEEGQKFCESCGEKL